VQRADMFRYFVLRHIGGVYLVRTCYHNFRMGSLFLYVCNRIWTTCALVGS
jgi:hypothetical protein